MGWSEEREVEGKSIKQGGWSEIEAGGWMEKKQSELTSGEHSFSLKGQSIWFLRLKEVITTLVPRSKGERGGGRNAE